MSSEIKQQLELIQFKDNLREDIVKINRQLTESASSPKKRHSKKEYNNA